MLIPKDNHDPHNDIQGVQRRNVVSEHGSPARDREVRRENAQLCRTAQKAEGWLNQVFMCHCQYHCGYCYCCRLITYKLSDQFCLNFALLAHTGL